MKTLSRGLGIALLGYAAIVAMMTLESDQFGVILGSGLIGSFLFMLGRTTQH